MTGQALGARGREIGRAPAAERDLLASAVRRADEHAGFFTRRLTRGTYVRLALAVARAEVAQDAVTSSVTQDVRADVAAPGVGAAGLRGGASEVRAAVVDTLNTALAWLAALARPAPERDAGARGEHADVPFGAPGPIHWQKRARCANAGIAGAEHRAAAASGGYRGPIGISVRGAASPH